LGNTLVYKVLSRYYQGVATPVGMLSTTKLGQHLDYQGVVNYLQGVVNYLQSVVNTGGSSKVTAFHVLLGVCAWMGILLSSWHVGVVTCFGPDVVKLEGISEVVLIDRTTS
jgi:hypothetical protein